MSFGSTPALPCRRENSHSVGSRPPLSTRRRSCIGVAWFLLAGFCGCAPDIGPDQKQHQYKARSGVLPIEVHRDDWFDSARARAIPVKIYQPSERGTWPLIVYSHGLGSQREDFAYLGRHWASHGYVVIHPTHFGTDLSSLFHPSGLVQSIVTAISDCTIRLERVLDVRFVLDEAARRPELAGRIDFDRVGVAGHSYGAHTALTLTGMRVILCDGVAADLSDPRIKAAIAISPQGEGVLGLDSASWERIQRPCLSIYGQLDVDFMVVRDPRDRRTAYDRSQGPDQHLLLIASAIHVSFSDYSLLLPYNKVNLLVQDSARMASTAFFDAYLRQDARGRDWLISSTITAASAGMSRVESKNLTPPDAWPPQPE